MINEIKKLWAWFCASHRVHHLGLGVLVGLGCDDWYCCEYVAVGVAGSLEFKDKQHGDVWDWIDFILTFIGINIGYLLRVLVRQFH